MTRKEASRILKRAQRRQIPHVQAHRYGNKHEWAVDFIGERTVYTVEQAEEYFRRFKNGEVSEEFRAAAKESVRLLNEAAELLGKEPFKGRIY